MPATDTQFRNIADFKALQIKLASPEVIKSWSHGEVTKPETINYRTLKPEKDGLFCEQIFGPVKDWECHCGKYKRIRYRGIICDKCGVEVTLSRVRRERMGHIALACPVVHIWYFKGAPPSHVSLLLNIPPKAFESVVYFAQYIVTQVDNQGKKTALNHLQGQLQKNLEDLQAQTKKQTAQIKSQAQRQSKKLTKKIQSRDQLGVARQELQLKTKRLIQSQRENHLKLVNQTKQLYDQIGKLVKNLQPRHILSEDDYLQLLDHQVGDFFQVGMGAEAILKLIHNFDLDQTIKSLEEEVASTKGQRRLKASKRLKFLNSLHQAGIDPSWMILNILPVIPPDLRPMVQLTGGRFATSDLNDLYRRVINRNNRLKHLINLGAPEIILRNEKRMLQEAVDNLLDSSQKRTTRRRIRRQPLRSLSDMLRGKQGRFRQNLLGKRVDYSARSVIVVGPELRLSECGLPKDIALEMFKPFVLRQMIITGLSPNVRSAKAMLERRPPEVYDILENITKNHPVLLNRAPTLHKLGIQAFFPVLVDGNAIQLHPCVCSGFNADFDGDQMAIHLPLTKKAQEESINLMLPNHNLLKPADGSPISIPSSKEMALGTYYLTSIAPEAPEHSSIFSRPAEAIIAYQLHVVTLRQPLKVRLDNQIITTTVGRIFFNETLPEQLRFINDSVTQPKAKQLFNRAFKECTHDQVIRMIDKIKDLGFVAGTVSGLSVSITDCQIYPEKDKIINQANQQAAGIEQNYKQGLITSQELKRLSQELWLETTEELADHTWKYFRPSNPIKLIIDAKVGRASRDQVKQLSAMKGLVVDPLGNIVELPTKSNYRQGLSIFEYVTSARGSRKGLTDSALKTADAGYLTRRLVDVAHEVIIREQDCGTPNGITITTSAPRSKVFAKRLLGRTLAQPIKPGKKTLYPAGEVLSEEHIDQILKNKITEVQVRSPLTCQAHHGLCATCYGWDYATKQPTVIGNPVGILAAQSIGEPGTQLTMRVKHAGGVVKSDVTQGLPRVEELFEARIPKLTVPLADFDGKISISKQADGHLVTLKPSGKKGLSPKEYLIPLTLKLNVEPKQLVSAGTPLAQGPLDIHQILRIKGLREAQLYLLHEIQAVYESQGIPIHDKHFEVIIRQMSQKVKIIDPGTTSFTAGELVNHDQLEEQIEKIKSQKDKPTSQIIILGISKASLQTESWLSAASFEQTTNVIARSALEGKVDHLLGLKENVIIGRLIPTSPERAMLSAE